MRKRTALKVSGVLFLGTGVALASSMPKFISDRIVDTIMEFGDKYIHGPFTKGGGDEQATRNFFLDVVVPAKWEKAFWDLTVGAESTLGSVAKDTPGYSQEHDGVLMPNGARWDRPQLQAPLRRSKLLSIPKFCSAGLVRSGSSKCPCSRPFSQLRSGARCRSRSRAS